MNGNGTLTSQLRVGVSLELKRRLKALALRQRRTLSNMVRILLEEALDLEESLRPEEPERFEYEIELSLKDAARLVKRCYELKIWETSPTQIPLL